MSKPNIFEYAHRESEQDTTICWLAAWADEKHKNTDEALHKLAQAFVKDLLKQGQDASQTKRRSIFSITSNGKDDSQIKIEKIETWQQVQCTGIPRDSQIDVLIRVNGEKILLIENKIKGVPSNVQLDRYYNAVADGKVKVLSENGSAIAKENITAIVFKTGNFSNQERENMDKRYAVYGRPQLLKVLSEHPSDHSLVQELHSFLQNIDKETEGYKNWTKDNTPRAWLQWQGFFMELKEKLKSQNPGWSYVPNPSSGFLSFWWHAKDCNIDGSDYSVYLQLEYQKLCFKLSHNRGESSAVKKISGEWQNALLNVKNPVIAVERAGRLRPGEKFKTMTLVVSKDGGAYLQYDSAGRLDIDATAAFLKKAGEHMDAALEEFLKRV